jgi:hypothetical protein
LRVEITLVRVEITLGCNCWPFFFAFLGGGWLNSPTWNSLQTCSKVFWSCLRSYLVKKIPPIFACNFASFINSGGASTVNQKSSIGYVTHFLFFETYLMSLTKDILKIRIILISIYRNKECGSFRYFLGAQYTSLPLISKTKNIINVNVENSVISFLKKIQLRLFRDFTLLCKWFNWMLYFQCCWWPRFQEDKIQSPIAFFKCGKNHNVYFSIIKAISIHAPTTL